MSTSPNTLRIDIHGNPGSGKSTFLRRLQANAQVLGIDIVSSVDGELPMGAPVSLFAIVQKEPAPLAEGERFAVCTPDGAMAVMAPEETIHDAIDYLEILFREADEHPGAADQDWTDTHIAKVHIRIVEGHLSTPPRDIATGRA